ncbi:glutathione S-transferase family protein [Arsenicitalea aurantiaca]|uniref:Glutathione S-transferase family protein n=1 Tax=Arsenicitalea aurantiaca TaxID=1783274 RepID=A0A433XFQ0_9HYPH|nr:glutathione S-transferase family protein [Arsenicitalea aurantiaca]RUT32834.1 glutathione S-transferase family protein [Arsenicitalea aurantiaca]
MADITIWGRLNSSNVQKAIWALEELGLDYASIPLAGSFGGNRTPEYLAMNPNGLVPTLRDGDLVLWESHAIVRYLAAAYGMGTLCPEPLAERAIVDQWTDWTATTLQQGWLQVFWLLVRTPPEEQDPVAIDRAVARANEAYAIMDRQLARTPFMAGDRLTYADIVSGASMYRWMTMDVERTPLPHLEAWYARLLDRPAYRKAVCVSYEELRGRLAF